MGELEPAWSGTRAALRAAIRREIRTIQRARHGIDWMLRVVREARYAALVAGAVLAGFSVGSARASPAIELSDITAGIGGFAIDGEAPSDFSGVSVSGAGDVNGDGLADLIVGAFGADPNADVSGRSYVIFGKAAGTHVRLSDVAAGVGGFAINGESAGDISGISVSGAGDVNGDGLADLIVGASRADPNGFSSGRSYVVFGKASETLVELSDITAGIGGFAIDGEAAGDGSGISVSAAGDVNGDGLADLIVGAPNADTTTLNEGRSYVVFGKADGARVRLMAVTAGFGGFAIDGERINGVSGIRVSAAGDVNGDGLADLIIGARNPFGFGSIIGRNYVVFGRTAQTRVQLSDVAAGVDGFVIDGETDTDSMGISVSGAGDVNGDGLADLIVGADGADANGENSGRSYVVLGKKSGTRVELTDIVNGVGGFAIDGVSRFDRTGYNVSAAGDVNGDGLADLIIGEPWFFTSGDPNQAIRSVRSYIVFGKASRTRVQLADITVGIGGFAVKREAFGDRPNRVSGAGDVNGDGLADVIVGARAADPNGSSSGRSYVIFSHETQPLSAPADIPRSAVYNAFSRAGDGPGGNPVVPTVVGDSRLTIDWPDDDFGSGMFNFQTSKERVVLNRNNFPIQNLEPIAHVARVCLGRPDRSARRGPCRADVQVSQPRNRGYCARL